MESKASQIFQSTLIPITSTFICVWLFAIPNKDIPIPIPDFWRNEITVTSSYGAAPRDLEEALKLIAEKKIDIKKTITHTLPLEEIQKGFDPSKGMHFYQIFYESET